MQSLMTYGMLTTESTDKSRAIEYHKIASDGKAYGIFKECSKYYIKTAPADKELVAEAYDYIGGWNNRKNYEYESFANAQKQFDLKMMSINEACGSKANAVSLDPSKKQEYVIEGTEKMKNELARQRQIMANTATIINEGSFIGVGDPEKVAGNNDEDKPFTEKAEAKLDKDMSESKGEPEDMSNPYGEGGAAEKGKDVKDSDVLSDGEAVAAQHPSGGKVARVNENCEDGACSCDGCKDWGSEGIGKGNGDPKSNGWEMEGQQNVNEGEINDAKSWDEGLPGEAGTGEADTDHNNDPFKEAVNESEDDDIEIQDPEAGEDDEPVEDEAPVKDELPADANADDAEEDLDLDNLDDFEDDEIASLEKDIEALRAELEALKDEVGAEDAPAEDETPAEETPAEDEVPVEDEAPAEEEVPVEDEPELGGEEDVVDDDMDECDLFEAKQRFMNGIVESVVKSILNEEKTILHDFGKHPGYRKKPMELPATGSDNENGMRDWNDDSVHSEAPFGQGKGDSKPYEKLVQMITDSVMESFKKKD